LIFKKHIFAKLEEITNKDNKDYSESIYKYFRKTTKSIIIYDIIIYKFKILKHGNDNHNILNNIIDEENIISSKKIITNSSIKLFNTI